MSFDPYTLLAAAPLVMGAMKGQQDVEQARRNALITAARERTSPMTGRAPAENPYQADALAPLMQGAATSAQIWQQRDLMEAIKGSGGKPNVTYQYGAPGGGTSGPGGGMDPNHAGGGMDPNASGGGGSMGSGGGQTPQAALTDADISPEGVAARTGIPTDPRLQERQDPENDPYTLMVTEEDLPVTDRTSQVNTGGDDMPVNTQGSGDEPVRQGKFYHQKKVDGRWMFVTSDGERFESEQDALGRGYKPDPARMFH